MRFNGAIRMRRWKARSRTLTAREMAAQLTIDLQPRAPVWVDPDDIPEEGDYFTHRWAAAERCEAPKARGPASIWEMAYSATAAQVLDEFRLRPRGAKPVEPDAVQPKLARVIRDGDVIRHVSMREQDTEEWAEKERIRRAKQKPPRPQRQKFKMKGTRQWADAQS